MATTRVAVPVETRAPSGTTGACLFGPGPALLVDPAATSEGLDDATVRAHLEKLAVDGRVEWDGRYASPV